MAACVLIRNLCGFKEWMKLEEFLQIVLTNPLKRRNDSFLFEELWGDLLMEDFSKASSFMADMTIL